MPASPVDRTLAEIRAGGGRITPARRAVVTAILDTGRHHFTATEIFAAVDGRGSRPDRATVYRTLELLTGLGVVTPIHLAGDATVYHRSDHRHGHLVCAGCGAIVEIPEHALRLLGGALEDETGFVVDPGRVAITGRCRPCAGRGT